MEWRNEPPDHMMGGQTIVMHTAPHTDVWRQPGEGGIRDSAHAYSESITGDFEAEVLINGDFAGQFDQAGIMIRADDRLWMKCGIEFVDGARHASVVVTREWSDWSLAPLDGDALRIKVTRHGDLVKVWQAVGEKDYRLLRKTFFPGTPDLDVGIAAASPSDRSLEASFEGFVIRRESETS